MNRKLAARVQKEIRKRAFKRADALRQQKLHLQKTHHTLDALQEVIGLHRPELESIADEAMRSCQMRHTDFFSIKNQILIASAVFGLLLILGGFVYII